MADDTSRRGIIGGAMAGVAAAFVPMPTLARAVAGRLSPDWTKLDTPPYPRKQDDIVFVTPDIGWYGNGEGRVYGTRDGGRNWTQLWRKPGTFVRALGFVDENIGILGNIGTDDFPDVTDTNPIYRTVDGGRSWTAATTISGPVPKGICAIDILRQPFVNSGVLDKRLTIRAGGRVGGPAFLMTSKDLGLTWVSEDMSAHTGAILDIHFIDEKVGFMAGASEPDVDASNAVVLRTLDGGASWSRVYRSARPFEITWKLSFPSRRVGYVTVQNYNEDPKIADRVVAKTTDGGATWHELPLVSDHAMQELGIGFLDERRGWVGGRDYGMETSDGGLTWRRCDIGQAVNKIRIVQDGRGARVFSIGREVRRLDIGVVASPSASRR